MYFLRITGRLSSDRPANYNKNTCDRIPKLTYQKSSKQSLKTKQKNICNSGMDPLPLWRENYPINPSFSLEKKLRRRNRDRNQKSPSATIRQNYLSDIMISGLLIYLVKFFI